MFIALKSLSKADVCSVGGRTPKLHTGKYGTLPWGDCTIKELDLNSLSKQVFKTRVQLDVILIKVAVKFFSPEDLSDTNELWKEIKADRLGYWSLILDESMMYDSMMYNHHLITCNYLVIIVLAVEKGLFLKNHTGQHTAQAPHV